MTALESAWRVRRRIRSGMCIRSRSPPPPKSPEDSKPIVEGANNARRQRDVARVMRGLRWK